MGFDLGTIRARVGLDGSDFVSGLTSMETASEIFGSRITQFINNPLLGTIRLIKDTTRAIAGFIHQTAKSNRELALWSQRVGVSTEFLSALAFAAEGLGIEMDEVGDTIAEVAVKARDSLGSADLTSTFNRIGVSVVDLNGNLRNSEAIFLDVTRGLANLENATERVAIVDELLSDAGKRLLPLLVRIGVEGFDVTAERARNYGRSLDRDAAAASVKFSGDLANLSAALDGVERRLATKFIEGFTREIGDSDEAVGSLADTLGTRLAPAAKEIGALTGEFVANDLVGTLTAIAGGLEEIWRFLGPIVNAYTTVGETFFTGIFIGQELDDLKKSGNLVPDIVVNRRVENRQDELSASGRATLEELNIAADARDAERARALGN